MVNQQGGKGSLWFHGGSDAALFRNQIYFCDSLHIRKSVLKLEIPPPLHEKLFGILKCIVL